MRILYVENHARFAKITISQFLTSHEVTVAPSVEAACCALADNTYHVALIDYDLDDGKADEVVAWLQSRSNAPLVIAVSSHQAGNDALMAAGANAVCSKMQFSKIESVIAQSLQSED